MTDSEILLWLWVAAIDGMVLAGLTIRPVPRDDDHDDDDDTGWVERFDDEGDNL